MRKSRRTKNYLIAESQFFPNRIENGMYHYLELPSNVKDATEFFHECYHFEVQQRRDLLTLIEMEEYSEPQAALDQRKMGLLIWKVKGNGTFPDSSRTIADAPDFSFQFSEDADIAEGARHFVRFFAIEN